VHTFIYPVSDAAPSTAADPPEPEQCCDLCAGTSATRELYKNIARTEVSDCAIFFLQYATNTGWVCQFYSEAGTSDPVPGLKSIAYMLP